MSLLITQLTSAIIASFINTSASMAMTIKGLSWLDKFPNVTTTTASHRNGVEFPYSPEAVKIFCYIVVIVGAFVITVIVVIVKNCRHYCISRPLDMTENLNSESVETQDTSSENDDSPDTSRAERTTLRRVLSNDAPPTYSDVIFSDFQKMQKEDAGLPPYQSLVEDCD